MNTIFLCGIITEEVKEEPAVRSMVRSFDLTIPGEENKDTLRIRIVVRDPEMFKRLRKIKPYGVAFLSGYILSKNTVLLKEICLLAPFSKKEKAMRTFYDIDSVNCGLLSGKVIYKEKDKVRLMIERDKGVFYGTLADSDTIELTLLEGEEKIRVGSLLSTEVVFKPDGLYMR